MASTAPARWWTAETVAVVTGANKGIGFEIVRQLALEGIIVVLAARDEGRGLRATEQLHAKGLKNVVFRKLDISKPESVNEFADWIKKTYVGLDILINNASVLYTSHEIYEEVAQTIDINYRGTINVTEKLLPLMKPSAAGARIINLGSDAGQLATVRDKSLREQLSDPTKFNQAFVDNLAKKYEEACKTGSKSANGYGMIPYSVSKVLITAYMRLLALRVADRPEGKKIYVNTVHPGMVDTGMYDTFKAFAGDEVMADLQSQGMLAPEVISVEQGADTPVWLALLPAGGLSGQFFYKRRLFSYYGQTQAGY